MKRALIGRTFLGVALYRWVLLGGVLSALLAVSIYLRGQLNIEWSAQSIRAFVLSLGMWGPLSYIGILVFRFLFMVPSGLLLLAAGMLFGPLYGTLYAGLGLFGSALLKFGLVSLVGQQIVLRQLPERLQTWVANAAQRRSSMWALGGICAYPVIPKHVFQFLAILSGMTLIAYIFAVATGSMVRAGIFAIAGEALYSGSGLISVSIILLILTLAPLCVSRWRRWMLAPLQLSLPFEKSRSQS